MMAYCRNCGTELPEGKRFCAECGEPTGDAPVRAAAPAPMPEYPVRQTVQVEYPPEKPKRKRKPIFRRWWFWVLIVVIAASLWNRTGGRTSRPSSSRRSESVVTTTPRSTPRPTTKPAEHPDAAEANEADPEASPEPEATPEPTEEPLSQSDIRPEFKEYMDSYEAFMDEYIEFMQKYEKADSGSAALMLYDYYRLMERELEFSEKLDAMEESDYTNAEWAYYLEVTNRVNQKLLRALG